MIFFLNKNNFTNIFLVEKLESTGEKLPSDNFCQIFVVYSYKHIYVLLHTFMCRYVCFYKNGTIICIILGNLPILMS